MQLLTPTFSPFQPPPADNNCWRAWNLGDVLYPTSVVQRVSSRNSDRAISARRWVERKRYPSVAVWKDDGFRGRAQPIMYAARFWRQPWRECGVTGRITQRRSDSGASGLSSPGIANFIRRPRSPPPRPEHRSPWLRGRGSARAFSLLRPVRRRPVRPDEVTGVTVGILRQVILMLGLGLRERSCGLTLLSNVKPEHCDTPLRYPFQPSPAHRPRNGRHRQRVRERTDRGR